MNRLVAIVGAVVITALVTTLAVVLTVGSGGVGTAEAAEENATGPSTARLLKLVQRNQKRVVVSLKRTNNNRRDVTALKAGGTAGATGPQGATGPAGSSASINGVSAGGALNGTFPNPGIASGAVGPSQLGGIPVAMVTGPVSTAQMVQSGALDTLAWSESLGQAPRTSDPFDLHSDGTNPERITVKEAGFYHVHAISTWALNGVGDRSLFIGQSGGGSLGVARHAAATVAGSIVSGGRVLRMNAGDFATVSVSQSSGVSPLSVFATQLTVTYLGPLA